MRRILTRWHDAAKEVPVKNKETGRVVWVLPETKEKSDRFKDVDRDEDPRQKPDPLRDRSRAPRRPRIPEDPTPAPVKPPQPPELPPAPEVPKIPKPLKPPRVPTPPKHRKWSPNTTDSD